MAGASVWKLCLAISGACPPPLLFCYGGQHEEKFGGRYGEIINGFMMSRRAIGRRGKTAGAVRDIGGQSLVGQLCLANGIVFGEAATGFESPPRTLAHQGVLHPADVSPSPKQH